VEAVPDEDSAAAVRFPRFAGTAAARAELMLITCGHSARYLRAAIAHSLLLAVLMCAVLGRDVRDALRRRVPLAA
jgi:hypothetical protein